MKPESDTSNEAVANDNLRAAPPVRRATRAARLVVVGFAVLAIGLAGAIFWAWTTSRSLEESQTRLHLTAQEFDVAVSKLQESQTEFFKSSATNAILTTANEGLTADKAVLQGLLDIAQGKVANLSDCISALDANTAELQRISGLWTDNFNRNTEGSPWIVANDAVIDDYYKGFSAAYDGNFAAANTWIKRGNAQLTKRDAATAVINAATAQLDDAQVALDAANAKARVTCGL